VRLEAKAFIVATDLGIPAQDAARRTGQGFIEAPTLGNSATARAARIARGMAMKAWQIWPLYWNAATTKFSSTGYRGRARLPIDRMLDFAARHKKRVQASGDLAKDVSLFSYVGAA